MEKRLPVVALLRKGEGAMLLGLLWKVSMAGLLQIVSISGLLQMVSAGGLSGMTKGGAMVSRVLLGLVSASWLSSSIVSSQSGKK